MATWPGLSLAIYYKEDTAVPIEFEVGEIVLVLGRQKGKIIAKETATFTRNGVETDGFVYRVQIDGIGVALMPEFMLEKSDGQENQSVAGNECG